MTVNLQNQQIDVGVNDVTRYDCRTYLTQAEFDRMDYISAIGTSGFLSPAMFKEYNDLVDKVRKAKKSPSLGSNQL